MSIALTLRDVNAAASVLAAYGASLPEPVAEARALIQRLRVETPGAPDLRAVGVTYLDSSPAAAVKEIAKARDLAEAHKAAVEVAASRALLSLREHADAVIGAVLSSPGLAAAVDEIATVAPTVRPDLPHEPAPGSDEAEIIGAARLRQAEATITTALTGLDSVGLLATYFPEEQAALVWVDPAEVADWNALDRGLRGFRPGFHAVAVSVPHPGAGRGVVDQTPHGIRSAVVAAVPGVSFSLATTYEEYERRVALVERGNAPVVAEPEPSSGNRGLVFL